MPSNSISATSKNFAGVICCLCQRPVSFERKCSHSGMKRKFAEVVREHCEHEPHEYLDTANRQLRFVHRLEWTPREIRELQTSEDLNGSKTSRSVPCDTVSVFSTYKTCYRMNEEPGFLSQHTAIRSYGTDSNVHNQSDDDRHESMSKENKSEVEEKESSSEDMDFGLNPEHIPYSLRLPNYVPLRNTEECEVPFLVEDGEIENPVGHIELESFEGDLSVFK